MSQGLGAVPNDLHGSMESQDGKLPRGGRGGLVLLIFLQLLELYPGFSEPQEALDPCWEAVVLFL